MKLHAIARSISDLLFRHWGTKATAFVLALVLFISTRDEVTRTFEIPLRVKSDPERVLMTELPRTVQIQVRGPWTRVNRLQPYDFGVATVDLTQAHPGPLALDRGSIVMPSGVVLADMKYDQVDLRFDPIIELDVPIVPTVRGQPADGHDIVQIESHPERWRVRGGRSRIQALEQLGTAPVDVEDASDDIVTKVPLQQPPPGVVYVGVGADVSLIDARIVIDPVPRRRAFQVATPAMPEADIEVPNSFEVFVEGPAVVLRELEQLQIPNPVVARVETVADDGPAPAVAEVTFAWADTVPTSLRERLHISPKSLRITQPERVNGRLAGGESPRR